MALLALLASAFNTWGGAQFAKIGKADPNHARSAVRRLYTLGQALSVATDSVRDSVQGDEADRLAETAQVLVSQVDSAQLHLLDAIGDWSDVHPEALREVLRDHRLAREVGEGSDE